MWIMKNYQKISHVVRIAAGELDAIDLMDLITDVYKTWIKRVTQYTIPRRTYNFLKILTEW